MGKSKWRQIRKEKEISKQEAKELAYPKRFRGQKKNRHGRPR